MPNIQYFPYFGPGRRSDRTVVEVTLDFEPGEQLDVPGLAALAGNVLRTSGLLAVPDPFPRRELPGDPRAGYASLLAQTALLLQRLAGHRVDFCNAWCEPGRDRCTALVEHEHCDVGMTAVKLALEVLMGRMRDISGPWRAFSQFARERALPLETEAIMAAARRRGIPLIHLERHPFKRESTESRCARINGLLQLGHGMHKRVLDGTFRTDEADDYLWALLRNPSLRRASMERARVPCLDPGHANDEGGNRHRLLAVNGRYWLAREVDASGGSAVESFHPETIQAVDKLHREHGRAPMLLTVRADDLAQAPGADEGIVDFDLAPRLDELLEPDEMDQAVEALLDWLFPPGSEARIPIVAVTGTNGKTTTTTMVAHIMRHAGLKPGMTSTLGVFLDGRKVSEGDFGSRDGHLQVLTSPDVDAAALETHHRAIMIRGFAFDRCDAAICLNVTEDHLGEATGIESVDEMAVIKRALPERAARMAVLNADDPHCRAMVGHVTAEEIGLVSLNQGVEELRRLAGGRPAAFCVLEREDGREWMVIHAGGERLPVVASVDIPATFGGTARFMLANAMHAALAGHAIGIDVRRIGDALGKFATSPEDTPGRLNVFDELPFRVIMDFAHNPDGMHRLAEFADGQTPDGRKIVAFAGIAGRPDGMHRNVARALAGHFDHYFCKEYTPREGFPEERVAPRLRETLMESGVGDNRITLAGTGREAVFEIFDACAPGDLLFLLLGHVEFPLLGGWIEEYRALRDL